MAATGSEVLRRKAGAGRPPPEIMAMSPEKAMRVAFGKAGRDLPGLALRMTQFGMERLVVSGLIEAAPERALVSTLTRSDGATGVAFLDPGFLAAVIEVEATGQLGKGEVPERAPTRIDALIGGALVDKALGLFDEMAAELSIGPAVTGFRLGDMLARAAMLGLVLEDIPYRMFRIGFDFGGLRQGLLLLAMPLDPPAAKRDDSADHFGRDLEAAVMAAPTDLRAVLTRIEVPLEAVTAWEPGHVLPMSREVLLGVALEDRDGTRVASGRLGQQNGSRAVRLRSPGDD